MDTAPGEYNRPLRAAEQCRGSCNGFTSRTRTLGWDAEGVGIGVEFVTWVVTLSVCYIFGDIQNDGTRSPGGGDCVGASYQFGDA